MRTWGQLHLPFASRHQHTARDPTTELLESSDAAPSATRGGDGESFEAEGEMKPSPMQDGRDVRTATRPFDSRASTSFLGGGQTSGSSPWHPARWRPLR